MNAASALTMANDERNQPGPAMQARAQARHYFEQTGFPTTREEAWKYTRMDQVPTALLHAAPQPQRETSAPAPLTGYDYLTIVNGYADLAASHLPDGLEIIRLDALPHPGGEAALMEQLRQLGDPAPLPGHLALNDAEASEAMLLTIPAGKQLEKPLEIRYIVTEEAAQAGSFTQLYLHLGVHSEATLFERFISTTGDSATASASSHFQHHIARIQLERGANLHHYRLHGVARDTYHLYSGFLHAESDASYRAFSYLAGGALGRQEIYAYLAGTGITCDQQGIITGSGQQHLDTYLPVFHQRPHSFSNQHFRQLLDDQAKGVFYGTVQVPADSVKTEAHQLNRNLLLSQKAQAISRPELDIHTDDVICSHGSTTGQMDQQALYYLQSRGLSEAEAIRLLTQAFISAVVEDIPDEQVRQAIEQQITGGSNGE